MSKFIFQQQVIIREIFLRDHIIEIVLLHYDFKLGCAVASFLAIFHRYHRIICIFVERTVKSVLLMNFRFLSRDLTIQEFALGRHMAKQRMLLPRVFSVLDDCFLVFGIFLDAC